MTNTLSRTYTYSSLTQMHHDLLLDFLDEATKALGSRLCKFVQKTCSAFGTKELQHKYDACTRRQAKQSAHVNCQTGGSTNVHNSVAAPLHVGQNPEAISAKKHTGETSNTTTTTISAEHHVEKNFQCNLKTTCSSIEG